MELSLLCLHEWGADEHPSLMSPDHWTPGNGLLLFFRVDDFDLTLQRARGRNVQFDHLGLAVAASGPTTWASFSIVKA